MTKFPLTVIVDDKNKSRHPWSICPCSHCERRRQSYQAQREFRREFFDRAESKKAREALS